MKIKSSRIAKAGVITGVYHKNVNLEEERQIITKIIGIHSLGTVNLCI